MAAQILIHLFIEFQEEMNLAQLEESRIRHMARSQQRERLLHSSGQRP